MKAVKPPANPEVFHITHVSNLPSILSMGRLLSHAAVVNGNIGPTRIGYDHLAGTSSPPRVSVERCWYY